MKNLPIIFAVILVIAMAGSFYGGTQYQKSQPRQGQNGQSGQFRQGSNQARAVSGQVLNSDDKSMTVKLNDGSSKIVIFSTSTTVSQASASAVVNIKPGQQVMVFGSNNSDGSVTAQNIQINPLRPSGVPGR